MIQSLITAMFVTITWFVLDKTVGVSLFEIYTHDYVNIFAVSLCGALCYCIVFDRKVKI
jgi:hypothetical protein